MEIMRTLFFKQEAYYYPEASTSSDEFNLNYKIIFKTIKNYFFSLLIVCLVYNIHVFLNLNLKG